MADEGKVAVFDLWRVRFGKNGDKEALVAHRYGEGTPANTEAMFRMYEARFADDAEAGSFVRPEPQTIHAVEHTGKRVLLLVPKDADLPEPPSQIPAVPRADGRPMIPAVGKCFPPTAQVGGNARVVKPEEN